MRVVIAPDSFKESLTAPEVAAAVRRGLAAVWPDADYDEVPLADGGEGTVDALVAALGGERVTRRVAGPLGDPVDAAYGLVDDGRTAVVEIAAASGLHLVAEPARDPAHATTRGTGELVAHALDHGARRLVLGLGGSATNDGGAGLLVGLGARVLDAGGRDLPPGGAALARAARLDLDGLHPALRAGGLRVEVACDVDNPLLGPAGATAVFGPQKGVGAAEVAELDAALAQWAGVLAAATGRDERATPGAGAAGGVGAAALAALDARLRVGFELVADAVGLAGRLAGADLVVTGEGRVDAQTGRGKAPAGVVAAAAAAGVPVVVLGGSLGPGAQEVVDAGAVAVLPSVPGPAALPELLAGAAEQLERTARQVAALWEAGRRSAAR